MAGRARAVQSSGVPLVLGRVASPSGAGVCALFARVLSWPGAGASGAGGVCEGGVVVREAPLRQI